jgi:hypothetical protein
MSVHTCFIGSDGHSITAITDGGYNLYLDLLPQERGKFRIVKIKLVYGSRHVYSELDTSTDAAIAPLDTDDLLPGIWVSTVRYLDNQVQLPESAEEAKEARKMLAIFKSNAGILDRLKGIPTS